MPSGKRESAGMHFVSALAAAQPQEIRQRRASAEQALIDVRSRLGAPGTYDLPGTVAAGGGAGGGTGTAAPSIFQQKQVTGAAATAIDTRFTSTDALQKVTEVDPTALADTALGSTEGRIVSRLLAESEQMLAREGPLWDDLIKNTQLPIIEGASAMARENAENIRRAMQRGGAARRNAFDAVQQIRGQERINTQKGQLLAQSRLSIDNWARDNARTNVEFAANWAKNLGGIREEYNMAMDRASELMVTKAIPIMFAAKQEAAKWRYYAHQKQRAKVTRWITGALGLGLTIIGAKAAKAGEKGGPELLAAGGGILGGAISGPTPPTGGQYNFGG